VENWSVHCWKESHILTLTDIHMLPVLCLLYSLQFLDKTSISYARYESLLRGKILQLINRYSVMNIIPDTHLIGTQYNWLGSAFYIGYLAAEYPVNRE
jgi:ACS family allantoate permease-like MFS transporter